jgi:predicted XRE-type DNA-binding protein
MAKTKNCENFQNFKRPRKTRSTLTLENKFKAIQLLKENKSERCVAEIMGVSRSQINRISISKEKIENFYQDKVFQPVAKVMANRSLNADLDKAVHNWFREMRNPLGRRKPLSLSRAIIQARALHEANKIGLTEFKASDGWFRNWRRRNGIGPSLRLFGEAGDVNIEEIEKLIQV